MGGPSMAPMSSLEEPGDQERWRHFDNSGIAVSFGFVATAILISMFLVMAIFERFLRARSFGGGRSAAAAAAAADLEGQRQGFAAKLDCPSPKMSVYAKGVSVLMPGYDMPTFIAHPAPAPCLPERISWPSHQQQQHPIGGSITSSS